MRLISFFLDFVIVIYRLRRCISSRRPSKLEGRLRSLRSLFWGKPQPPIHGCNCWAFKKHLDVCVWKWKCLFYSLCCFCKITNINLLFNNRLLTCDYGDLGKQDIIIASRAVYASSRGYLAWFIQSNLILGNVLKK